MPLDPAAAVAAYAAGSLGFTINAQGFLIFYVLGAVKVLGDLGLLGPQTFTASRGTAALASAAVCSKTPYDDIVSALQQCWSASQDPTLSISSRRAMLRQAVDKMLPADAHTLCSNRTFIQTMSILDMRPSSNPAAPSASSSTSSGSLKKSSNRSGAFHVAIAAGTAVGSSVLAGVFGSREALLNAVVDSSFPMLTTAAAAAAAANEKSEPRSSSEPAAAAVQLSQAIGAAAGAVIPCPAHIRHCVRISAVPPLHNAPIGSSSSSNSLRVLNNSSSSSSGTAANKSRAAAHADIIVASVTSNSSSTDGSSISIQADKATAQDTELVASSVAAFSAVSADIYPGLSQHMLLPRSEWLSYMMLTPSIKTLSYMHYLGRVDAYVWANSTGLVKAAVAEQQQQLTGLLLRDISAVDGVDALFAKFVDWQSGQ